MTAIVFAGPTISPDTVRSVFAGSFVEALVLPPAAQGDVYRAALSQPAAIAIVDGYFSNVPSIWHKEILWAMSRGIHVFGSASMGALRAAELEAFGMIGIGAIFESYRNGIIEDDDEVAVAHANEEYGFRASSESMVNIRATVASAQAGNIVSAAGAETLLALAKTIFYPERTFPAILELALGRLSPSELDHFRRWLPGGRVDQKREDALAMLVALRDFLAAHPEPKRVSYHFEETHHWEELQYQAAPPARDGTDAIVLERLRRDPVLQARVTEGALSWHLAADRARRERLVVDAVAMLQESAAFCRLHGLTTEHHVQSWLDRHGLNREDLHRILRASAMASYFRDGSTTALEAILLDYLRWTGGYLPLLSRAGPREP